MPFPIVKKSDSWLDIALKAVVVVGICWAVMAYAFTVRPALNTHKEILNLLISQGADVNAKNKQGNTVLDYARSPAPQNMIILSAGGTVPYSVIVTRLRVIRGFLRSQGINFDQIWIPEKEDLEGLDVILKRALDEDSVIQTQTWFSRRQISDHLDQYNREYAGFINDGVKYVICNMDIMEGRAQPPDNDFTEVWDGGCSVVKVVFQLDTKTVVRIDCNFV